MTSESITNWELNRNEPSLNQIPKVILFLGYTPLINDNPIKKYRIETGISQKKLARILNIDATTLSRIERAKGSRINNKIKVKLNKLLEFT